MPGPAVVLGLGVLVATAAAAAWSLFSILVPDDTDDDDDDAPGFGDKTEELTAVFGILDLYALFDNFLSTINSCSSSRMS